MTTERMVRIFAGTFILISLLLGTPASPLEIMLKKAGVKASGA